MCLSYCNSVEITPRVARNCQKRRDFGDELSTTRYESNSLFFPGTNTFRHGMFPLCIIRSTYTFLTRRTVVQQSNTDLRGGCDGGER